MSLDELTRIKNEASTFLFAQNQNIKKRQRDDRRITGLFNDRYEKSIDRESFLKGIEFAFHFFKREQLSKNLKVRT